mmetsp:Transcript_7/g.27  ORF Transcript_7/g.27 Transcript_7/m.27 type:complete len:397 (+) Transcript_7:159-1349(+)
MFPIRINADLLGLEFIGQLLQVVPQVGLDVNLARGFVLRRDGVAALARKVNFIHTRLLFGVLHAVQYERGFFLEVGVTEQLRVDGEDQVTPVLGAELVVNSRADERTGEKLDDERQVGRLVSTIERANGTTLERLIRIGRHHAILILRRAFRNRSPRRARFEQTKPRVRRRRHVEHHRPALGRNTHTNRIRPENRLLRPSRRNKLWRLRHRDRNQTLIGNLLAIISERPRRRARVARPGDAEPIRLGLFQRHLCRLIQHQHPLLLTTINMRRQRGFRVNLHRHSIRRARETVRRHLDDALIISAQLRIHEHIHDGARFLRIVPLTHDGVRARRFQFINLHARAPRRGGGRSRGADDAPRSTSGPGRGGARDRARDRSARHGRRRHGVCGDVCGWVK